MKLSGIIPVLPTPFTPDGDIDFASFEKAVDHAIDCGASAAVMFGLASEYYKLDWSEHVRLRREVAPAVAGRVPVIISVTHHATEVAAQQARAAVDEGADAVMVLPPFFLNPPPQAIAEHVREIAGAVRVPLIVQYAPAQTGIAPEVLASLAASYVKVDAVPSFIVPDVPTIIGYNGLDLPRAFAGGCVACMPGVAMTRAFVRIWGLLGTDFARGQAEHARLLPLLQFMMESVEKLIACEKHILQRRGVLNSAYSRRPRVTLNTMELRTLERMVSEVGDLL